LIHELPFNFAEYEIFNLFWWALIGKRSIEQLWEKIAVVMKLKNKTDKDFIGQC